MQYFQSNRILRKGEILGELLIRPFQSFASMQASSGILLLAVTIVALAWINSSIGHSYERINESYLGVSFNGISFHRPLHFRINEGLMTIFFFLVGLEIKREILIGELASFRQAALPVSAALGGMIVPAILYYLLNPIGLPAKGGAFLWQLTLHLH